MIHFSRNWVAILKKLTRKDVFVKQAGMKNFLPDSSKEVNILIQTQQTKFTDHTIITTEPKIK